MSIVGIVESNAMKSRLAIALIWILIFLLGGIAGAVSYYLYSANAKASVLKTPPKVEDVVQGMAQKLRLDAQQKESVKTIINESRNRYRALNKQFRSEFEEIRQQSDDRIRALLHEGQKPLFEEFLRQIKSKPGTPSNSAASKK